MSFLFTRSRNLFILLIPSFAYVILLSLSGCGTVPESPLSKQQYREWKDYGGGPDHSKYVELDQITKLNVSDLEIEFIVPTYDQVNYQFNPIVVDGVMYILGRNTSIIAVDATTGEEIWIHEGLNRITPRGINFWQSDDKKQKRLIFFVNNTMQAIDAFTGKSIMDFGETGPGYTDMRQGLGRDPESLGRMTSTTPGHVFEDLILVGSAPGESPFSGPGHLRAYSVITGKMEWIFHTIPFPDEYGYETWPKDAYKYVGATNVWGEISVDVERGIAYYPIGSPTYDFDGADRHGSNVFGNCILALDARTGKRLWHFQTVHHDLWDYDLTAAPQLITVQHEGKEVDAVAVAAKTGFLFVFDRVTGEPLWPIEERAVPQSEMPDEESWPTQPFPTVLPPFTHQDVTVDNLNPYYDETKLQELTARINAGKTGLFQPLSTEYETVAIPGSQGGANYGNTASEPEKGIVYVQAKEEACFYSLKLRDPRMTFRLSGSRLAKAQSVYAQLCQTCHGEDMKGLPGLGSNLLRMDRSGGVDAFKQTVSTGKGRMPGMPHVDEETLEDLYIYLSSARFRSLGDDENEMDPPAGPVVDSGGVDFPPFPPRKDVGYPDDYEGPKAIYIETNNWGESYPDLLAPPWTTITAYDLNQGSIKWRIPLGNDDRIDGGEGLGFPNGTLAKGMIVTSTGLLFATSGDGRIYAFDNENGETLWTGEFGRNPRGIPAMYEVNGKQYLVVCVTGQLIDESLNEDTVPRGYMVFSLPNID